MTERDKQLISDFLFTNIISEEEFLLNYSGNLSEGSSHFKKLIKDATLAKDSDEVEAALSICAYFGLWNVDLVDTFNELLLEDWHFQHENIALSLQAAKDPKSINALYLTALKELEYLNYDDGFELARKCTWALADINTPEAIEKLKLLANSDNPIIQSHARKRLNSLN